MANDACAACANPWDVYYREHSLAINDERHSSLYHCSACGAYYEVFAKDQQPPKRLIPEDIAERFDIELAH